MLFLIFMSRSGNEVTVGSDSSAAGLDPGKGIGDEKDDENELTTNENEH